MDGLGLAVVECGRVLGEYRVSENPSGVLIERLVDLERALLVDYFRVSTADKPERKVAKKPGKSEKHERTVKVGNSLKSEKDDGPRVSDSFKDGQTKQST